MSLHSFDLLTCPLRGSSLLEAGAGTGKTFSLAFLYLRLLLERGLVVDEILVTTFTNAATAELKGRIFTQIQQAQQCFDGLCQGADDDALIQQFDADALLLALLHQLRETQDDTQLAQRLRLAVARFDYANIASINGFALHLLRENIDVLGTYAPEEILDDDSDFVKAAYLELARENFATLENAADIGEVAAGMSSADLLTLLTQMLNYRDEIRRAQPILQQTVTQLTPLLSNALAADHAAAIRLIDAAIADKQLNGRSYPLKKLTEMAAKVTDEAAYYDKKFLTFFSRANLLDKRNKNAVASFEHPFFTLCDELLAVADQMKILQNQTFFSALLTLTDALQQRVAVLKAERMALTHDDIVRIAAAGAAQLNTSLTAALIDEAQDTNSHQLTLFRQLFLQRPDSICFFVGDPKQAIYGFRGANLYSYLDIQNVVQRHYVMDTNYRSTQALNACVNTFFSGETPFGDPRIPYHHIGWKKPDSRSDFGHQSLTLLTADSGDKTTLATTGAAAIAALLSQAPVIDRDESHAGGILQPADIAVLVRSASQAEAVKTALAVHGLAASYTGKVSVYQSDEAKLLLALLTTIHSGDPRRVKALLLTPLFSDSLGAAHDETTVITRRARLQAFADIYRDSGFSVMFYRLLKDFHIAGNLLQSTDGKRRLSNFIQLFELLQSALQKQSLSLSGLCDRLAGQIHDAEKAGELRLEDDQAVTIMTMHSAKGLEFPVVCLPFFEYDYPRRPQKTDLLVSHQQQKALPAAVALPDLQAHCQAEEQAEAMRLAYVALTRAEYHNIIIRQPSDNKKNHQTAMLTALLATLPDKTVITEADFLAPELTLPETQTEKTQKNYQYQAKTLSKPLYSAWQLASFSRLQQQAEAHADHHAQTAPADSEPVDLNHADELRIEGALADYPPGPRPGTALHEMYEHYMQHRQNDADFTAAIDRAVAKHLYAEDQATRPDSAALAAAIADTAAMALTPHTFCLNEVAVEKQSIEMQFFMHLAPQARQQLLAAFEQPDLYNPPIIAPEKILPTDGYLHGFIDYWFEHNGKYYVLDYKSNRLGEHYSDYQQAAMHAEMRRHRYDLQAVIYTLALCKHLFIQSKESYEEKIGGYYYLFVRGMRHGSDSGIYHDKVDWDVVARLLSVYPFSDTGE